MNNIYLPTGLIFYEMTTPQSSDVDESNSALRGVRERRFPKTFNKDLPENKLIYEMLSRDPKYRPDIDRIISVTKGISKDESQGTIYKFGKF